LRVVDSSRAPNVNATSGASSLAAISVFFCFLAALCEGFDIQAAGVAALGLSRTFTPTPEQLGLFFSAGNAGLLVGAVVGGRLADRFGRKIVLVCSIGIFGVFSLVTASAWSMESLTWMRVLTGLGLGGSMPNLIALASEVSEAQSRNAKVATTYIGMPVGGALASLIVLLLPVDQWRVVFVIGGIAPLLIAITMMKWMPTSHALPPPKNIPAERMFATGTALREIFGRQRLPRTLLLWTGFFLMQVTLQLMLNWLPLLMQARGLAKGAVAAAQIGFNAGGAAGALMLGVLLDTRRARPSIGASVVALPIVLLLLAIAPALSAPVIGLAMLLGGSVLAFQVILYGVANHVYPSAVRGAGLGAAVAVGRAGAIAGPAFGAFLLGTGRSSQQVLVGVLPIAIVCGFCVAALGWQAFRESAKR
jgi:MFS transporter, AAHS family, 3-hydroxyphenylpropionic acid transporter